MNLPNEFGYYQEKGVVKRVPPDNNRSNFLISESEKSILAIKERVKAIGITDTQSNSLIKDSYDSIMELIRAIMLRNGFNAMGQGAHEAEVAYLQKLDFKDNDILFLNQLRYFRNGISYYGKSFDSKYAKKVIKFMDKIVPSLKEHLK